MERPLRKIPGGVGTQAGPIVSKTIRSRKGPCRFDSGPLLQRIVPALVTGYIPVPPGGVGTWAGPLVLKTSRLRKGSCRFDSGSLHHCSRAVGTVYFLHWRE